MKDGDRRILALFVILSASFGNSALLSAVQQFDQDDTARCWIQLLDHLPAVLLRGAIAENTIPSDLAQF